MGVIDKIIFYFSSKNPPKYLQKNYTMDIPIQNYLSTCWLISAAASIEFNYPGKLRHLIKQIGEYTYLVNLNNKIIKVELPEYIFCCQKVFATTKLKEHWMAVLEIAFAKLFSNSTSTIFNLKELKFIEGGYSINAYQIFLKHSGITFKPNLDKTNQQNLKTLLNLMCRNYTFSTAWFGSFCFKGKNKYYQEYFKGIILNHSYSILRIWWDDDYAKKRKSDSNLPKPSGLIFLCYNPWGFTTPYKAKKKDLPAGYFILKGTELMPILSHMVIYPCIHSTNDKITF